MSVVLMILVGLLTISNTATLFFLLRKPKLRRDSKAIQAAIDELQRSGSCMIELRKIDDENLFIWGRPR